MAGRLLWLEEMASQAKVLMGDDALPEFDLRWSVPLFFARNPAADGVNWADMPYGKAMLLFADDSEEMIAALVRGAKKEGFTTLSDTTSTKVLELAKAHHPDVIVLDLHQAIDGRDLLCDLKSDPETCDIKVVILSAEENQLARHECFSLGAEDYFVKPLDPLFFRRLSQIAGIERDS
jgi:two-component system, OmpR family, response regulator AdeR